MDELSQLQRTALARLKKAKTADDVQKLRAELLGKKSGIGTLMQGLAGLGAEERRERGQAINQVKQKIEEALADATARLDAQRLDSELALGAFDASLPGRRLPPGAPHPIRLVEAEVINSLAALGFEVATGPLVEHDWYNFEALNIAKDHPARDMQDTFFVGPEVVLRTHTSNVQIRVMEKRKPPVRILAPGMVFRRDEVDATHLPIFHQIEGLWIDERATFADLRGVLRKLGCDLFGPETRVRFRPSFFPFTEPSAEFDVSCASCGGRGRIDSKPSANAAESSVPCRVCKASGWVEMGGCGMVNVPVLEAVGYDPETVQGFAFGFGLERIAMMRWRIDDIRLLVEGDLRFSEQFVSRVDRQSIPNIGA